MARQLDAELVEVVRLFRQRRRWRHVFSMIIGAVLLVLGSAVVAAHFDHHTLKNTPSPAAGAGLYVAGALLFGWGGAGGFTARLAKWLPGSLILGVLAVLVFMVVSAFSNQADGIFSNGRPQAGSSYAPAPPHRPAASPAAHRVLAAELLDRSDIERLLGPAPADLQTPGSGIARNRSLAIWRAASPGQAGGHPARRTGLAAVSLTVQRSARQAGRLHNGHRPPGTRPVSELNEGGYVRHHDGSSGQVTRVRAGRGEWVVALQLRAATADDLTQLLAANVAHMLDLLAAASTR